jgi:hypothetical protein
MYGWEHDEELVDGIAVVQVIKKRLSRNPRSTEDESAAHEFGVGMDRAVIERQHRAIIKVERRVVNDSPACARHPSTYSGSPAGKKLPRSSQSVKQSNN